VGNYAIGLRRCDVQDRVKYVAQTCSCEAGQLSWGRRHFKGAINAHSAVSHIGLRTYRFFLSMLATGEFSPGHLKYPFAFTMWNRNITAELTSIVLNGL